MSRQVKYIAKCSLDLAKYSECRVLNNDWTHYSVEIDLRYELANSCENCKVSRIKIKSNEK